MFPITGDTMKRRHLNDRILITVLLFLTFLFRSCCHIVFCPEHETYTSPEGTNTIIIHYDLVCRPTVYKQLLIGKKKIWEYPAGGFMETTHFSMEWLSEDTFRLFLPEYNEDYTIRIP